MDLLATGILLGVGGMIIVVFLIALLDKVVGEPDMSDIVAQYIKEAPMRRLLAMRRMLDEVIEERRLQHDNAGHTGNR